MNTFSKFLLGSFCLSGLFVAAPVWGATTNVSMIGTRFVPPDVTIAVGDTVTWENLDRTSHDTVSGVNGVPSGIWKSRLFGIGGSFSFTFSNAPVGIRIPYYCTPHVFVGMVGSITVLPAPPTIDSPANGASFTAGDTVLIQATASDSNSAVARMDFFANGIPIGSVTNPPYTVTLTNIAEGNFALSAVAVNNLGVSSAPAVVNIAVGPPEAPGIISQPQSRTNRVGSTAEFGVVAAGRPPPQYQWQFNGIDIPGATNAIYSIAAVQTTDAGTYVVIVFNQVDSVTSQPARLVLDSILPTIAITNWPPNFARTSSSTLLLSGIAADELGLACVEFQVNSGPLLNDEAESRVAEGTTSWSAAVSLSPGNNAVRARSIDQAGNISFEAVRFITYDHVAAANGAYAGLFVDTNAVAPESSGFFSLQLGNFGVFSGKLVVDGGRFLFRGQFNDDLHATVLVPRGQLVPLGLTLALDPTAGQIRGTVTNGVWTAELLANRNAFLKTSRPAPQAGAYPFVLDREDGTNTIIVGTSLAKIATTGKARFRGSLSDGRKFSMATSLAENGDCPFYLSLGVGTEVMVGWLRFPANAILSIDGNVFWVRSGPGGFTNQLSAVSRLP